MNIFSKDVASQKYKNHTGIIQIGKFFAFLMNFNTQNKMAKNIGGLRPQYVAKYTTYK